MNRFNRPFAALLVFALTIGLLAPFAPNVRADDNPIPYENHGWVLVSSAEELIYMDRNQASYIDRNIRLTNDIDMTGYEWIPFGGNETGPFSGIFDGRGHRIEGVTIDGGQLQYVGFFGRLTGTVRDLSVSVQAEGGKYAGGLTGLLDGGAIIRSSSRGAVTGGADGPAGVSAAGGLAGAANGNSTISRSYSAVAVKSGEADNQYAGGLVGSQGTGSIRDSYATGTVTNSAGHFFTGGGLTGQLIYGTITNSYATGAVDAAASSTYVTTGGLVGFIFIDGAIISSYFDNETTLQTNGVGSSTGGVIQLTGRSTADMKIEAHYGEPDRDWDFEETWAIRPGINASYPYLRPYVLTTELPRAVKAVPYSLKLESFDGAGSGAGWNASGLPAGIRLTAAGVLEGTPAEAGAFPITFTVSDAGSATAVAVLTFHVDETAPDIAGFGIGPGGAFGSTRVTAAASGPGSDFAYTLGERASVRPLSGAPLPVEAIPYSPGEDISPVSAGQILQIYETDEDRRIRAWSSIRVEATHLQDQLPPTAGSVTGTVYGAGNAPLSGAAVTVGRIAALTDAEGHFALRDVAQGTHTLTVSAGGYRSYSIEVNVVSGEITDAGRIELTLANVPGSSGGSNGSPGSAQPPATNEITLKINGHDVRVPMKKERESDGRSVIRLALGDELLRSLFAADEEVVIVIAIEDPIVKAEIPAATLQTLSRDRPGAVLRIHANGAGYNLPLRLWNGVREDATVTVSISRTTAAAKDELNEALAGQGLAMLAEPIDFSLSMDGAERKEANGVYTKRTLSLAAAVNSGRTTVAWMDAKGRPHFVPSVFEKEEAIFYSPHNGVYAVIGSDRSFKDAAEHWARADIELLANKLVVAGTSPDTFEPDRTVTRAEFSAMLVRALGLVGKPGPIAYSDVRPGSDWYDAAVGAASEAGLIEGYEDGTFRPNELVTREQAAVMLARAIRFAGDLPSAAASELDRFSDQASTASWAKESAARLLAAGIIEGVDGARFAPKQPATRAQSAVLLTRALRYLKFIG